MQSGLWHCQNASEESTVGCFGLVECIQGRKRYVRENLVALVVNDIRYLGPVKV